MTFVQKNFEPERDFGPIGLLECYCQPYQPICPHFKNVCPNRVPYLPRKQFMFNNYGVSINPIPYKGSWCYQGPFLPIR
jgi:hypothetical protein